MRIIDDEEISALTGDGTVDADGVILTTLVGSPTASGLAVLRQGNAGKDFLKIVPIDQPTNFTAKANGQFGGMR